MTARGDGQLAYPLSDERSLETAETTLQGWATILADAGRDAEAADALRVANALLKFRCGFLGSEKRP